MSYFRWRRSKILETSGRSTKSQRTQTTSETETWPNFSIVGTVRGGTTSLYEYLKRSPGVFMSKVKEPRYFAGTFEKRPRIEKRSEYLQLFQGSAGRIAIGEATPSYLVDPDAPENIYSALPHARIIIMLRNPADRAFSHWHFNTVRGQIAGKNEALSFRKAIEAELADQSQKFFGISRLYLEQGYYAKQVERYLKRFPKDQVKVVIFEDFIRDTNAVMQDILSFLHLEPLDFSNLEVYNAASSFSRREPRGGFAARILNNKTLRAFGHAVPIHARSNVKKKVLLRKKASPRMRPEDRKFLDELFKDDIMKLENLLGFPLNW